MMSFNFNQKKALLLIVFLILLVPGYKALTLVWDKAPQQPERNATPLNFMVSMRDGVRLATDVYLPPGDGSWPVVLSRTPYEKALSNPPKQYTDNGYAFVIQNTRGRHESEGTDTIYQSDGWGSLQDGYDTCAWIVAQKWCNGKIGTVGTSASGITQCLLAPTQPPGLVCQVIGFAPGDFYDDWAFPGDAPQNIWKRWLEIQNVNWFYDETFNHFPRDKWWDQYDLITFAPRVKVPALHITGWYDMWTEGAIRRFQAWQKSGGEGAKGNQRLIVGPWSHADKYGVVGCDSFPDGKSPRWDSTIIRFFDYWLKGKANGLNNESAVTYWEMMPPDACEKSGWKSAADFPHKVTKALYLNANQTMADDSGTIEGSTTFAYDPKSPWQTIGGSTYYLDEAGPQDLSPELQKNHHLFFSTKPLKEPLKITGEIECTVYAQTDVPSSDLAAIVVDILPDGRNIILVDGIKRVRWAEKADFNLPITKPGDAIRIKAGWTSYVFLPGHRIGLVITGGNWPRFERNPQNGELHYNDANARSSTNRIFCGGEKASRLLLPVVED